MELYSIALAIFIAFSLSLNIFFFFRSSRHPPPYLALPPVSPPPSLSTTTYPEKYDVFLSFRGVDTRSNFTSYLYDALLRQQIRAFIDDRELDSGARISPSLLEAIEQSKVSVIIFSKNYASSKWCLDELVKILDCMEKNKQIVIPVFYKIDPSNVRNQRGSYSLFPKHWRLIFQGNMNKLSKWKAALTEAASLSGRHSMNFMSEPTLMDKLVQEILLKLNRLSPSEFNFKDLVGMKRHIKNVESQLHIGSSKKSQLQIGSSKESQLQIQSSKVRTLGIWGMPGIGKTAIAEAALTKLSPQFNHRYFVPNVKEQVEKLGLTWVRDKYLSDLLGQPGPHIVRHNFERERLSRKNAFVVFDDVDKSIQHEMFTGPFLNEYLGSGSRVIVTSRDRQVLENVADAIYEVSKMCFRDSLRLFSSYAFRKKHPVGNFRKLSESMVNYCDGNPLALKVLGSSLYLKSKVEWESALKNLNEAPHKDIQAVMKMSYEGLDQKEKEVFLDIACFFTGEQKTSIVEILGDSAIMIMGILTDLSLIFFSEYDSMVRMHDLVKQMGLAIVLEQSPKEPGKRSRLWRPEEIYHVLKKNTGTKAVECIILDMSEIKKLSVTASALENMSNLRILKFYDSSVHHYVLFNNSKVLISEDLKSVFYILTYFHWVGYPWQSVPLDSSLKTLEELNLPCSQVKHLWDGVQHLPNLRLIDLRYSKLLTTFPDLSKAPNLKYVNLYGCRMLSKFPVTSTNIVELNLSSTAIEEVPSSIGRLVKLSKLDLSHCHSLRRLSSSIWNLKSRLILMLSDCPALKECPEITKQMKNLWALFIDGTSITKLPSHLEHLIGLEYMNFSGCKDLQVIPVSISNLNRLRKLFISKCPRIERFPLISGGLRSLEELWMDDCSSLSEIPSDIDSLSSLQKLSLRGSNIARLPSIKGLTNLGKLDLSDSKRLQSLPELPPSLGYLDACGCSLLKTVSSSRKIIYSKYKKLIMDKTADFIMDFTNCLELNHDAYDNIVEDALLGLHYCLNKMLRFEGIFPGSEIPEGFTYQSEGPSLTIERIPRIWGNAKSWGFVACVIFEVKDTTPLDELDHMCEIKCENDGDHFRHNFPLFGGSLSGSCRDRFFEKDHAVINCYWDSNGYSAPTYNSDGYHSVTFTIVPDSFRNQYKYDPHPHYHFKVKKVGIYLKFSPKKEENGDEEDKENNREGEEDDEGDEKKENGDEEDEENNGEEEEDDKGDEEEDEDEGDEEEDDDDDDDDDEGDEEEEDEEDYDEDEK